MKIFAGLCLAILATVRPAFAAAATDDSQKFFSANTVSIYIGDDPGSSYDIYGRLVAVFLPKYIPGSPRVIVRNMPGAGGVVMSNWLYSAAPRDGSAIAIAFQGTATEQRMGSKGISYEAKDFSWIGRISPITEVIYTWATSKTKTLDDAKQRETIMGSTGLTSPSYWYLKVLNALAGTRFKGIPGFAGNGAALIAMQNGDVEGFTTSWATLKSGNPELLRDHKFNLLVQFGPAADREMPNVPSAFDLGNTPQQKEALKFFTFSDAVGRSLVGAPKIPTNRLAVLQTAYTKVMQDPEFIAYAKKANIPLGSVLAGDDLRRIIDDTLATPDNVIQMAKQARGDL